MKTIKNKELVVGADFAGYPLKEAVVKHLREKGWKITDMGGEIPGRQRSGTDVSQDRTSRGRDDFRR